ncbi:MAG TPA: prepilin-type N-terminal cleavage/methylation domain-containing protein [Candidatus Saccharimonadales bacterium]
MRRTTLVSREQGFTLIELLIISIIVCVLGTLVAMTYSGVQAKNRNSDRQAGINALQSQLETYYAQKSQYPSLAQINDSKWRIANLEELATEDLKDPQWNDKVEDCTANGQSVLSGNPTKKCYSYQATATDGSACDDVSVVCAQYTLTTVLEGGEKYVKSSLN